MNHLARLITGRVIASAWMDPVKTINTGSNMPWPAMARRLKGKRISRVSRRAKYIVIHLTGGSSLWIHQKMTGHLLVGTWRHSRAGWVSVQKGPLTDDPRNRHIRLVLGLGGRQLALSDARRFARAIFVPSDADIENIREISGLGPEPLGLAAAVAHLRTSAFR